MGKVIECDEKKCYGCTACKNICPKCAITMKLDEEGFLYPYIDEKLCINCNLCRKVCPALEKQFSNKKIQETYAVKLKNEKERLKSRSGGVFVAISNEILKNNGSVFGAAFKKDFSVHHIMAENITERDKCRGSKYIQSNLESTFKEAYEKLKENKKVLYTGTPCQIQGLNSYLKLKNIKTDNLYTCDIVCHGVPSTKIYNDYINFFSKKYKNNVKKFDFRDKSFGWSDHVETIEFESGKKISQEYLKNLFYSNYILRPRCYECEFTNLDRVSDITIADCWGSEKNIPEWNDDKGISLVILNTEKGKKLFEKSLNELEYKKINIKDFMQTNLYHPTEKPKNRQEFWDEYKNKGFKYIFKKYGRYTVKDIIKNNIKVYKIKIKFAIKKTLKNKKVF